MMGRMEDWAMVKSYDAWRDCAACGKKQGPYIAERLIPMITRHEFECYKQFPSRIPTNRLALFKRMVRQEAKDRAQPFRITRT